MVEQSAKWWAAQSVVLKVAELAAKTVVKMAALTVGKKVGQKEKTSVVSSVAHLVA